ncbi:MAG: mechanosensitive ion channel domain-containing protein [Saprospiraceae bacterium]
METKTYLERIQEFAWLYGPKILTAIAILVIGLWVIKRLIRAFNGFLRNRHIDSSLRPFFISMTDVALKVTLLLVVASTIGLETTSFIAVSSVIAFSIGLALQGSLGNFASGVLILLFRPFRIGDYLTVQDKTGKVVEIQIFSTILETPQGKKIIVPNRKLTEESVENMAETAEVQAEVSLLLTVDTSMEQVRFVAEKVLARCPHALPGRPPIVQVTGINRDDVKAQIGCWTTGEHYDEVMCFLYEELKLSFQVHDISLAKERRKEGK